MNKKLIFHFKKLQQKHALMIANEWKYEGEYAFYDMTADQQDYEEFIDEKKRNQHGYYEAYLNHVLVGFFCIIEQDNEIEIGLGLAPNYCGKGIGKIFLNSILTFIDQHYPKQHTLCLLVATFNQRAIKVYESCGFVKESYFNQRTNGSVYPFVKMTKNRKLC